MNAFEGNPMCGSWFWGEQAVQPPQSVESTESYIAALEEYRGGTHRDLGSPLADCLCNSCRASRGQI